MTNYFVNSLWISYFHEFTSISLLIHEFTSNSFFFREFIISLANSLRIHYLFRKFTSNSLFFFANLLWIHYFFPNSLWIPSPLRDFTIFPRILYRFTLCFGYSILIYNFFGNWQFPCAFTFITLSFSRIHFQLTV